MAQVPARQRGEGPRSRQLSPATSRRSANSGLSATSPVASSPEFDSTSIAQSRHPARRFRGGVQRQRAPVRGVCPEAELRRNARGSTARFRPKSAREYIRHSRSPTLALTDTRDHRRPRFRGSALRAGRPPTGVRGRRHAGAVVGRGPTWIHPMLRTEPHHFHDELVARDAARDDAVLCAVCGALDTSCGGGAFQEGEPRPLERAVLPADLDGPAPALGAHDVPTEDTPGRGTAVDAGRGPR